MVSIIEQSGKTSSYITGFVIDDESELTELPTIDDTVVGSWCLVIATSDVYMLNSKGEWKSL